MADPKANERSSVAPTRTELVWPGKRTQVERVALPFQVAETINQSRATREQTPMLAGLPSPPLFEGQTNPDTTWKNKLIWGENKYIMASLLEGDPSIGLEPLAGKIDLIYIDPPFATGQDFSYRARVGDEEWVKEASIIEETAYRDTWGRGLDSYLQMMYERLVLMRDLLSERGSIYVHVGVQVNHMVRLLLEEVFGKENEIEEIVWSYGSPSGGRAAANKIIKAHEYIVAYARSYGQHVYNKVFLPYSERYITDWFKWQDPDGRRYQRRMRGRDESGAVVWEKQYLDESKGTPLSSVWTDVQQVYADPRAYKARTTSEILPFPTQKPEALLGRIIKAASNEGDLVADFFSGSGTTMAVAERLGRRWIGCDLSRYAIQVSRKRMLEIQDCKPFQVLNLGKYERKHWQVNVLNGRQDSPDKAVADYLRFIVALYHAEPVGGYRHLHGQKAGRWVHVGASDAPVTRAEIMDAVRECQAHRYTGLDVLGWEWEMGLHDTIRDEARRMGVDLRLLVIPREVMDKRAVQAGDVRFYELAYLKTALLQDGKTVTVRLDAFIIPNPDLVPNEVRSKVKKWSDYIDFWAVDWNYQADTFHNEWQTYRTRKTPTLRLISDPRTYEQAGDYNVLVKVIDIFGNDTTQLLEVKVP